MTGQKLHDDLTKQQLEALAGGPWLFFYSYSLLANIISAKKNSLPSLEKFFFNQTKHMANIQIKRRDGVVEIHQCSLAIYILIILAQMKARVPIDLVDADLALINDQLNLNINQFSRFLSLQATDFQHYASLLPKKALQLLILELKYTT